MLCKVLQGVGVQGGGGRHTQARVSSKRGSKSGAVSWSSGKVLIATRQAPPSPADGGWKVLLADGGGDAVSLG